MRDQARRPKVPHSKSLALDRILLLKTSDGKDWGIKKWDFKEFVWCGCTSADMRKKLGPSINCCHMHTSKASRKTSGFHSEKIANAKKNEGSPNVCQVAYPKKAVGSQAELNMGGAATPLVFSRDIWLNCISGPHLREYIMAVLWWFMAKIYWWAISQVLMCNRWSIWNHEPGPSVLFETSFIRSGTYSRLKQERDILSAGHRHRNSSQADLKEGNSEEQLTRLTFLTRWLSTICQCHTSYCASAHERFKSKKFNNSTPWYINIHTYIYTSYMTDCITHFSL